MILALEVCGAVLVAVLLLLVLLGVRRRWIQRLGGTFDCSLRRARHQPSDGAGEDATARDREPDGKGWTFGVARYNGDRLEWFRVFSYAPRPRRVLTRGAIEVVGKRRPRGEEEVALLAGAVVLDTALGTPGASDGAEVLELAMSEDASTGFLAWLEAAPPGQHVNVA